MDTVAKIRTLKRSVPGKAYLWLHESGDCLLWPSEEESIGDDGRCAIRRWHLSPEEAVELRKSGLVDCCC